MLRTTRFLLGFIWLLCAAASATDRAARGVLARARRQRGAANGHGQRAGLAVSSCGSGRRRHVVWPHVARTECGALSVPTPPAGVERPQPVSSVRSPCRALAGRRTALSPAVRD